MKRYASEYVYQGGRWRGRTVDTTDDYAMEYTLDYRFKIIAILAVVLNTMKYNHQHAKQLRAENREVTDWKRL